MVTDPHSLNFEFYNQDRALKQLNSSRGHLCILDALPGYGKTAFLSKIKIEYEKLEWRCVLVDLEETQARNELDTVAATIQNLCNEEEEIDIQDLHHAVEILVDKICPEQSIALMFDHVQCLHAQTLEWIRSDLSSKLRQELRKRTGNKFLLIFSGHNIGHPGQWPLGSRLIQLTEFQREAINELIDIADISELQNFIDYRHCIVEKIFQFSGGHPRSSIKLIEELKAGWIPFQTGENRDMKIFEKHIEPELGKITEGLEEVYKTYLFHLVVFRSISFDTIRAVEQGYSLEERKNPLQVISEFRQNSLFLPNRYAPSATPVLNPFIRQGWLAYMMLYHKTQYQAAHRFAQVTYQSWSEKNSYRIDDVINSLRESIYHCLSQIVSQLDREQSLEENSELINCLHHCIKVLNQRKEETMERDSHLILENILNEDEESIFLLQQLNADWSQLLRYAFFIPNPENSISENQKTRDRCKALTIALMSIDDAGKIAGTGFWVWYRDRFYVITCAHVIEELQKSEGDILTGRTFGPPIHDLSMKVIWFRTPKDMHPQSWTAKQDVAILRPLFDSEICESDLNLNDLLPSLERDFTTLERYRQSLLYSFGYPGATNFRGESFPNLLFGDQAGSGFFKLVNQGSAEVDRGVSGSPLCHVESKQVVGMIQSKFGRNVAYCIPSITILEVLNRMYETLE